MSRLRAAAATRVPTRAYMSLALASVMLFSVVASAGLLALGMQSLMVRYALVALLAYGLFVLLCRVALSPLVEAAAPGHDDRLLPRLSDLGDPVPDLSGLHISAGGGGGGEAPVGGAFGGGASGGGGAGSAWEGPAPVAASSSSSGGGGGGSLDLDGEGAVALLLVAVVLALFGASIWVVWQAPAILTEAAFEVLLAAGLARAARRRGWATAIVRSTIVPFGVVLLLVLAFGWAAGRWCPEADRIGEVLVCVDQGPAAE